MVHGGMRGGKNRSMHTARRTAKAARGYRVEKTRERYCESASLGTVEKRPLTRPEESRVCAHVQKFPQNCETSNTLAEHSINGLRRTQVPISIYIHIYTCVLLVRASSRATHVRIYWQGTHVLEPVLGLLTQIDAIASTCIAFQRFRAHAPVQSMPIPIYTCTCVCICARRQRERERERETLGRKSP